MNTFQRLVYTWLVACFGESIANNKTERNHRFLEESLELVQSLGCTKEEALQLVEYVFNRQIGEPEQEIGGVLVTLSALVSVNKLSLSQCAEKEIIRACINIDKIRQKQAAKPKFSPLPQ